MCQLECNVTSILFHPRSQIIAQLQYCDRKAGLQLCRATVLSSCLQGAMASEGVHACLRVCMFVCACLCVCVCVCSVAQSCLTLCNPKDYNLPGSSVHEIFQARILEQAAIFFLKGSSQPRDQTRASCI